MKQVLSLLLFLSFSIGAQELQDFQIADDITAGQLSANGANCTAGSYPLGVDESGAVEGCTVAGAGGGGIDWSDPVDANIVPDVSGSRFIGGSSFRFDTIYSIDADLSGDLIVSGNVDGRDVSVDGGKLDGIESLATADQTQSDVEALGFVTGSHTVDTNTQNNQSDIEAFGFVTGAHTTDTNTQLTDAQVAVAATNEGFVVGAHTIDTDTQIDQAGIEGFGFVSGPHTVDTNTQLNETEVDAFVSNNNYSTGAHTIDTDTRNNQADVEALGFVVGSHTTDTNTQLSDAQVATAATNEGFVAGAHTIDTNTQLSDAQVATAAINEGFVVGGHTVDTDTNLSQEEVEDFVDGVVVGGTDITATYNDTGGTLTLDYVGSDIDYITRTGRFYLYTDNRWVTGADDNYGISYYQFNESGTTAVDPVIEWEWIGHYIPAGTKINALTLIGRTNNIEATDLELYVAFKGISDAQLLAGYDNDAEDTVTLLYRDSWMSPVGDDYGYTFTGTNTNDIRRRRIDFADYTTTEDGYLIFLVKPVGTLTANRYFLSSHTWEVEY